MFQPKVEKAFGTGYCLGPFHTYPSHQGKLTVYLYFHTVYLNGALMLMVYVTIFSEWFGCL